MREPKSVPVHNLKVTRKGKVKKRNFVWRMRRVVYFGALAVMVLASGLAYVLTQIELPGDPLANPVQKQTSFVCAADVQTGCDASNAMAQLHGAEDRVVVTFEQIPEVLRNAVISAEDRDFFEHGGVDPMGIARAAYHDIRGTSVARQGGSTITQQYVKTEYLSAEQTFTRKIREAVMAIKLEQKISKQEILTRYLNTVYFGRGAYGVQAASRAWFGHDVETINAGEAAFLAGLLRSPNGADPYKGKKSLAEANRRRRVVLTAMHEEGYLTDAELGSFLDVPMDPNAPGVTPETQFIRSPPKASTFGEKVKGSEFGSKYFVAYVQSWLYRQYSEETVLGGGLKVYTTLDLSMQQKAFETVTETLDRTGDPSAAIVTVDNGGRIKAMMGGKDWDNDKVNVATGQGGSGRQAGSTFKIFTLADAVRKGYSINSIMPGPGKVTIPNPECRGEDGKPWEPKGGNGAPQNLISATKNSTNTVYAALMMEMGTRDVAQTAMDMGVRSIRGKKPQCAWGLGGVEVNPLEMASAYATIMNGGIARSPIAVTRVEFPDGRVDNFTAEEKRVLTPQEAGRITYAMEQVIDGGTGKRAAIGRPAAGKTGTTQNNADAWFVGFTPTLSTALWMGYPASNAPMKNVHGQEVSGSSFPAQMWSTYMKAITDGTPVLDFPEFSKQVLGEGRPVRSSLGTSTIVATGQSTDQGGTPESTTPQSSTPRSTTPQTSSPQSSAPQTTAVQTTAPATTESPPQTTAPAAGGGDGSGGGGTP